MAAITRKSPRLKYFDYTMSAAYFITICVEGREPFLSTIERGGVKLQPFGEIVLTTWLSLEERYPYVIQDHCVVMPDHFHGIMLLVPSEGPRKPVTQLIGAFKTMATKEINCFAIRPGNRYFNAVFTST
jgi:putative transposase